MLGAKAEADQARRDAPQKRDPVQKAHGEWRCHLCAAPQHAADHPVLHKHLEPLRRARRKLAAAMYGIEIVPRDKALKKARA